MLPSDIVNRLFSPRINETGEQMPPRYNNVSHMVRCAVMTVSTTIFKCHVVRHDMFSLFVNAVSSSAFQSILHVYCVLDAFLASLVLPENYSPYAKTNQIIQFMF